MRTEELIATLARGADPVDPRLPARRLGMAALAGFAAALPLMLALLGVNAHLAADARLPGFWIKWVFVAAVAVSSGLLVLRIARPAGRARGAAQALALVVMGLWLVALVVLWRAPPAERGTLLMGSSWDSCPLFIAVLSLPALLALMLAMRSLAPTRLRLAGAATGLFAGSLGTLAYLLHCPELAAPFIALWYVLGMAIPALLGALLAPRVLHW
jgi:hypothetical protein